MCETYRERERERGIETAGYEPFAMHVPIQWVIQGGMRWTQGSCASVSTPSVSTSTLMRYLP